MSSENMSGDDAEVEGVSTLEETTEAAELASADPEVEDPEVEDPDGEVSEDADPETAEEERVAQYEIEDLELPDEEDDSEGVLTTFVAEEFDLVSTEISLEDVEAYEGPEAGTEDAEGDAPTAEASAPEEPETPEKILAREITPAKLSSSLKRLHRTLAYAVEDEGERLWSLSYLEKTCTPIVEDLLGCILPQAVGESLLMAQDALRGVDALRWDERLLPLQKALRQVNLALEAAPQGSREDLLPQVQLVDPAGGAEVAPEGEGGRRRRRKRGRRKDHSSSTEENQSQVQAPAPSRRPRFMLGDPAHTGMGVSELDGVDDALQALLEAAGILTIEDLLLRSPTSHNRLSVLGAEDVASADGVVALQATVRACWTAFGASSRETRARLQFEETETECVWVKAVPPTLYEGDEVVLVGELSRDGEKLLLVDSCRWKADARGVVRVAQYGVEGIEEVVYGGLVREALARFLPEIVEPIPEKILKLGRVQDLRSALEELHLPIGGQEFGTSRLVFGELFLQQLRAAIKDKVRYKGVKHSIGHERVAQLHVQYDMLLGDSQERAFDEIRRDLRKPRAMTRLLQGDVGSGKALVALLSAVVVAEGKSQVLFLAPSGLAAEHRALFAEPLLRSVGLVSQLVTGEPSKAQVDAIRRGEADIVFATHDLLERNLPEFKKLGLVVMEQRLSFGVVDRTKLVQGKNQPDLLVVTSVPIPSSLAFTLFADHEISLIEREQAAEVQSQVLSPDEREQAYAHIREIVEEGKQAYVVFPLRNGTDILDRERGTLLISAMGQEAFPGARVALFHGSMTREERYRVFEDFKCRRIDVLLATTEIEDAPEIHNAAAVMVENADHFDLVRLHRIRGHVSCGTDPGACYYILSAEPSKEGAGLVQMVAAEPDGFAIAEQDRIVRGDQALLGEQAAELPPLRWAHPTRDRKILLRARRAAFELLAEDPKLRNRTNRAISRFLFPDGPVDGPLEEEPQESATPNKSRRRRRRRRGGRGSQDS